MGPRNIYIYHEFVKVNLICSLNTKKGKNGLLDKTRSADLALELECVFDLLSFEGSKTRKYAERTVLHVLVPMNECPFS